MSRYKAYPEYRDSGVEWLGEMPSHWNLTRVKEVAVVVNGYPFDAKKFDPTNGVPLVRIRDIFSTSTDIKFDGAAPPNALINSGDILIGMDGDFNVATWAGGTAALNQRVACVRSSNSKVTRYLYYVLPLRMSVVNDLTYFTTVKHLSSVDISKTNFALPPHNELESIVAFLDHETAKIDALIEKQQRLIELLKEKRQAVISHAVTKGLNPNAPMKDSGVEWLGEVPAHWELMQLRRTVSDCVNGIWGNEPENDGSDTIVIRVADFDRPKLSIVSDGFTYRKIDSKEKRSRVLARGDLLLEKSGGGEKTLVGQVVLFDKEFAAVTSNFVAKMTPGPNFSSSYLNYVFCRFYSSNINYCSIKQNTGIQNLDSASYLSEKFGFPPLHEQERIAAFLDHKTAKIDTLIEKQQRLIELAQERRTALISAAVTGKIDVRDWQAAA